MPIEYRSHTADIRMVITAKTLKELFQLSLEGMSNIMKAADCDKEDSFRRCDQIELKATDVTNLLIDFLSEVLSMSYVERSVYCKLSCSELTEQVITAEIYGRPVDQFDEEIKAVTYHEADVRRNPAGDWEVTIIFDI